MGTRWLLMSQAKHVTGPCLQGQLVCGDGLFPQWAPVGDQVSASGRSGLRHAPSCHSCMRSSQLRADLKGSTLSSRGPTEKVQGVLCPPPPKQPPSVHLSSAEKEGHPPSTVWLAWKAPRLKKSHCAFPMLAQQPDLVRGLPFHPDPSLRAAAHSQSGHTCSPLAYVTILLRKIEANTREGAWPACDQSHSAEMSFPISRCPDTSSPAWPCLHHSTSPRSHTLTQVCYPSRAGKPLAGAWVRVSSSLLGSCMQSPARRKDKKRFSV